MTSRSELLSPVTKESGEGSGRGEPRGQVMAADDEDDMEWLDYEEQMQDPKSDEGDAEYEFQELEMGFNLRRSEGAGVPVGGEVDPRQHREPQVRVRGLARPASLTKTQRRQHNLEGHAKYHPGGPFCVR